LFIYLVVEELFLELVHFLQSERVVRGAYSNVIEASLWSTIYVSIALY
jgi:hypothetical protein